MLFFEVFEGLDVGERLGGLFRDVTVERVVASRDGSRAKVYIKGQRPISHADLRGMEEKMRRQILPGAGRSLLLIPRYELPDGYTAETLLSEHLDSILEEIREESVLDAEILREADFHFEDGRLLFELEDNPIVRGRERSLRSWMQAILHERCGLPVEVAFGYARRERRDAMPEDPSEGGILIGKAGQAAEGARSDAAQAARGGRAQAARGGTGAASRARDRTRGATEGTHMARGGTEAASRAQDGTRGAAEGAWAPQEESGGARVAPRKEQRRAGTGRRGGAFPPDANGFFYGKPFEGDAVPISQVQEEMPDVVIQGKVLTVDLRDTRIGNQILSFHITDFTDTITGKLFLKKEEVPTVLESLKVGSFLKVRGMADMDRYDREIGICSITGLQAIGDFTARRKDGSARKRVELHAHTMMSEMDAVADPAALVQRAREFGHPAVAITDHGVVHAFPDASHALKPGDDLKILYGCEIYLVDDVKDVVENDKGQDLAGPFVVFDIETTGLSPERDKIIEIGAVKVEEGRVIARHSTFVNPQVPIPGEIVRLTGITDKKVRFAPPVEEALPAFLRFCEGCALVAHNASFDVGFIERKAAEMSIETDFTVADTVGLSRALLPDLANYKLNTVARRLGVSLENHHRAVDDAEATAGIFLKLEGMLRERGVSRLAEANRLGRASAEAVRKMPTFHAVVLAKNDLGRRNLYRLVSLSHIDYFHRRPRVPKSVFLENREGLLIGSACEAGELFQAILRQAPEREIARLVNFYDYLEIQPLGNNAFMIRDDKYGGIRSADDLKDVNRRIVALGERFAKPVVATCDVHFLDPEDEVYRRIIMSGKGFKDADSQPPLYFRTTEEMLAEFAYLGKEKAEEVVITNTNLIADRIERISPVRPDKCPPSIPHAAEDLRKICYDRAHAMYGDPLPDVVAERLERELRSIIRNGFAVMYIIAQKLVWKSNEDGYLVGSRGSVGSSFVATMAGITEVNPLPAHYYCENPSCRFSDFDSDEVRSYAGRSGFDMPDRACPRCGRPLRKDGHDIPFETFLGFYGDKEPDIDLNFSGEYQSQAHDYTEVIFGKGQTFRAGTIGTLADKTAYGYVLRYNEEHGIQMRKAEVDRIVQGCVGVKRTTGQHPGGIIVLPLGEDIDSFTPVQRPANDTATKIVTTHFDYHSIDHNLLKLDILGHDDPTMIRMLEDLTGKDARTIRLDDEKVLSLFDNAGALGIPDGALPGLDLGCLGIPEFGTDFVMQMLRDTKPKSFSDLVRISGLSHGTDVWLNNAQQFIREGKCTLSSAICTRDDIMTFLIYAGVEKGLAFRIMESVRKGKGLTPDMEEAMVAAGVPDWYMESCKRIKYMFPKAHAVAYVTMAFRIAWFKVYEPLAYYAAYFSIRASAFDYATMCQGRDRLELAMADSRRRSAELTKKEQDAYRDMRIVQEMYARGFSFLPIDIYRAEATRFQIIDGKLMPSLNSIDGMGDKAAEGVREAARQGAFLSKDDFKDRSKVGAALVDTLSQLGLLEGIPESNQMSLADLLTG